MKRVDAYLDDETYAALKAEAKKRGTSLSAVGRGIVCATLGIVDKKQHVRGLRRPPRSDRTSAVQRENLKRP